MNLSQIISTWSAQKNTEFIGKSKKVVMFR